MKSKIDIENMCNFKLKNFVFFLQRAVKTYNILNNRNCDNKYRNHKNHDLNIIIDNVTWKRIIYIYVY